MKKVKECGIDLDKVLDAQISDGLVAFEDAFRDILDNL